MKIILTGTSGLVGPDVWNELKDHHELWAMGRNKPSFIGDSQWKTADIRNAEETFRAVTQLNPDCVIHLAALSSPDACEDRPEEGYRTNALGTRNIALACQKFDTELLYVSSDQVFGGDKKSPYHELDSLSPLNHYGQSKRWAETFVQTLLRRFYIVRTSLVFGSARPTFVDRVAEAAASGETVTAATDIVNSPTYTLDFAKAVHYLIGQHLYGTIHIANEGFCSRYELAGFISKHVGKKSKFIKKGKKGDLPLKAKRPGYTPLENFVWNLNGFPKIRSWQDAVKDYLNQHLRKGSHL